MRRLALLLLCLAPACATASSPSTAAPPRCAEPAPGSPPDSTPVPEPDPIVEAPTPTPTRRTDRTADDHCIGGAPTLLADVGPTHVLVREGYALLHADAMKIPLWVCEDLSHEDTEGDADRKRATFKPEPSLEAGQRAELKDYRGSGYDRGHNAPAADFKASQRETDDSFFLSNMTPQVGVGFNRAIWADLEAQVRRYARGWGHVWVITGSYVQGEAKTIGPGKVAVPTHVYKIVVRKERKRYRIAAFVLENRAYSDAERGAPWSDYLVTLDALETAAKIDFLPTLSARQQAESEAVLADLTRW